MADSTPSQPTVTPITPAVPDGSTGLPPTPVVTQTAVPPSNKSMLWVILAAFLVVAVLVGIGIYIYMQAKTTNPAFQQVSENVQSSLDSASNDLSGVKDDDVSADFTSVDKDLSNL